MGLDFNAVNIEQINKQSAEQLRNKARLRDEFFE
mgnify:CR=1 FL=1